MADDTTSSPDPTSPESSTPAPAEQAVEWVEESMESVESVELVEQEEPIGLVEQGVEQTAEAPVEPPLDAVAAKPTPEPVSSPPEPSVATTLVVEPTPAPLATQPGPSADGEGDGEGGEWELLLQKLRQWLNQGELQSLWSQARKPVTLLAALVGLLLVLRVYNAVLGALDSLPLVPGLLELAGVVWSVRYGVPKLLRSSERERLLSGVSNRWKAFRGKG
jgi:hypothetical protein